MNNHRIHRDSVMMYPPWQGGLSAPGWSGVVVDLQGPPVAILSIMASQAGKLAGKLIAWGLTPLEHRQTRSAMLRPFRQRGWCDDC